MGGSSRRVSRPWRTKFAGQFRVLFWKQFLVSTRNIRATILRTLSPLIFMFLLWVVNIAVVADDPNKAAFDDNPYPSVQDVGGIPACADDIFTRSPCWDFYFSPNTSVVVQALVASIRESNPGRPIPADQVLGFRSIDETNLFLRANPGRSLGALHFLEQGPGNVSYVLQANGTAKYFNDLWQDPSFFALVPMQVAAERAIASLYWNASGAATPLGWSASTSQYAHPATSDINIVGQAVGPFVFAANMFTFVLLLASIVAEREKGLRQALRTTGMLDSAFWLSWTASELVIGLLNTLLLIAFGAAFQFRFFLRNSFWLVFFLFFCFQLSMTSVAFLLSTFLSKGNAATNMGFTIFIVGWIMQSVVAFGFPFTPENISSQIIVTILFILCPWALLSKGSIDLGLATAAANSRGIPWSDRYNYCQDLTDLTLQDRVYARLSADAYVDFECVLPLPDLFIIMFVEFLVYWLVAVWLDNVLPDANGVRRRGWYFLQRSYWHGASTSKKSKKRGKGAKGAAAAGGQAHIRPSVPVPWALLGEAAPDPDVAAEEARMRELLEHRTGSGEGLALASGEGGANSVEVYGLQRVFRRPRLFGVSPERWGKWLTCGLRRRKAPPPEFWAVKGSWFAIERGQLFCLLGPNGAGKSTTINLLTGVLPPSGGDALVYGESLSEPGGIDRVRPLMGVCPQFDVLWGELTGYEHLYLYGLIKGLPRREVEAQAFTLLDSVKLAGSAGVRTAAYSGGMRRRLSVAIALLGDPLVVYLDEPTTGMDPISRRHVWDIIEASKPGRAIVLTTHSMEEADILGDRIGIMARGTLRALGPSLRLKQRFGSGYQLSVSCAPVRAGALPRAQLAERVAAVSAFFKEHLGVVPADETLAYSLFLVPRAREPELPAFLRQLDASRGELGVTDVQIGLASLEEVFLSIARKAEVDAAAAEGRRAVEILLPDGHRLEVPLGAEFASCAESGVHYAIKWAQDAEGNLAVLRWTPIEDSLAEAEGEVPVAELKQ